MASRNRFACRILAVLVLGVLLPPSHGQEEGGLEKWLECLYSTDSSQQAIGAHQLLSMPEGEGLPELRRALSDPGSRADVAIAVLSALSIDRDPRLLEEWLGALADPRPGVAAVAQGAFYACRNDKDVLGSLLRMLDDHELEPSRRILAADAIGRMRSLQAVEPLVATLGRSDGATLRPPEVDQAIEAALGAITRQDLGGDPAGWRAWWEAHRNLTREQILDEILDSRRESSADQIEPKLAEEMIALVSSTSPEELQLAIQSSLSPVRIHAAKNLGKLGGDRAAAILLAQLEREEDVSVQTEIASALGAIADPRAAPLLVSLLADIYEKRTSNPGLHDDAARLANAILDALGRLRDQQAVGEVTKLALDLELDRDLRANAVDALGHIGGEEAFTVLSDLAAREKDLEVMRKVAQGLGRIGSSAVDCLVLLLGHFDPLVRFQAADSLGRIGDARAVDPLLKLLGDQVAKVREAAVVALSRFGGERAAIAIGGLLQGDRDELVKRASAAALKTLAHPQAIPALVASQTDRDADVRAKAWEALLATIDKDRSSTRRAADDFLARRDRADRAAELYRRLLEASPPEESGGILVGLAQSRIEMGEPAGAAQDLAGIVDRISPTDHAFWPAHLTRVRALALSGDLAGARTAIAGLAGLPGYADRSAEIAPLGDSLEHLAAGSASFQATHLLSRLDLDDAARAEAFRAAGNGVVQALDGALDSTDPERLLRAVQVLRILSNASYGFDPAKPIQEQAAVLEKWREWLRSLK